MPHRDQAPIGAPCWTDLLTTDKAKAVAFYTELFGWTAEDMGPDYGGYVNFSKDGIRVAGCMTNTGQSPMPDFWAIYLAVRDAKATVDQAVAHGSAVIVPAMDVMQL